MSVSAPARQSNEPEAAVYWFARLVNAVAQRDDLLATEAHTKLFRAGWSVVQRTRREKEAAYERRPHFDLGVLLGGDLDTSTPGTTELMGAKRGRRGTIENWAGFLLIGRGHAPGRGNRGILPTATQRLELSFQD